MSNRIDHKMTLGSSNVEISPLHNASADIVAQWQIRQREHLLTWMPEHPRDYFSESFWQRKIWKSYEDWREQKAFRFLLTKESQCIGRISLFDIRKDEKGQRAMITYSLSQEEQGQGIMSQSVKEVLAFARDHYRIIEAHAHVHPKNLRSQNLLEGLNFRRLNEKASLKVMGKWCDHHIYSKLLS